MPRADWLSVSAGNLVIDAAVRHPSLTETSPARPSKLSKFISAESIIHMVFKLSWPSLSITAGNWQTNYAKENEFAQVFFRFLRFFYNNETAKLICCLKYKPFLMLHCFLSFESSRKHWQSYTCNATCNYETYCIVNCKFAFISFVFVDSLLIMGCIEIEYM